MSDYSKFNRFLKKSGSKAGPSSRPVSASREILRAIGDGQRSVPEVMKLCHGSSDWKEFAESLKMLEGLGLVEVGEDQKVKLTKAGTHSLEDS